MPKNVVGRADHAAPTTQGALMAQIRKALIAVLGLAAQVIASGALDGASETDTRLWVQALLAVATAAGVYVVPNKPAAAPDA